MGTCEGWLLLTDMDGTLLSPEGDISEGNRKAIVQFVDQGGKFAVATGRMPASVIKRVSALPVNCPIIICNGAGIYDLETGTLQEPRLIHLPAVRQVLSDVMRDFPDIGLLVFEVSRAVVLTDVHWLSELAPEEKPKFIPGTLDALGDDVFKLVFTSTEVDRIAVLRAFLEAHPIARSLDMMLAADTCLELLLPNVSKGAALRSLRDRLGIAPERVLAIGDYENDAEMLRAAGISAAPENAHPDILALADMVVAHHGRDAVADFLGRVFGSAQSRVEIDTILSGD